MDIYFINADLIKLHSTILNTNLIRVKHLKLTRLYLPD